MTTPSLAPAVRLDRVTKTYGGAVAVEALSLDIAKGEFFTLLGPSGCGKTTTLRMIGGFIAPDSGRVLIDGRDVTREPPNRRPSNMVFQQYALFPHLSVRDNVAFGPREARMPRDEIDRRVGEALELVHLDAYGDRRPNQLSGGQQQRVALARALVNNPSVLLLDEPLGALDLKMRRAMQDELKRIQREIGITFIYVTHDQEEALTMSDRIVVMRDGVAEQIGTPIEIYERPATLFVAGFIGEMNVLPGVARGSDGRLEVDLDVGGTIAIQGAPHVSPADRVAIVLRPEALSIGRGAPDPGTNRVTGRVVDSVFQGPVVRVVVALADGTRVAVALPKGVAGALSASPEVHVEWRPEDARVLKADAAVMRGAA